ncbi:MAG: tetratricopeptide repeat protein [Terracidiphilus sp.]|jgi:tol-pal system protein YbgF
MKRTSALRNRIVAAAAVAALLLIAPLPAHATSKEIIEMQSQMQQLLDSVQRLQSTMDKGFAVLQNLAQQTADNATQMNAAVTALQKNLAAQNEATNTKLDTSSGQVQSLNDSVDELKARINKLDKSIQDLQTQLQNIQNPSQAPAAGSAAPAAGAGSPAPVPAASAVQAPPLKETFQAGVRDYNAAKYEVAGGEFQDVIQYYPADDLAGTAQFYVGEIAYRQKSYENAVKAYNAVLEGFPGNSKAPAAQLHKGLAQLQMDQKQAGINELRSLIKRHPQTPEAAQAHAKLTALGVKVTPAH